MSTAPLDFNVLGQKLSGSFAFQSTAGNDVSITASSVSRQASVSASQGDVANPFVGVKFSGGAGLLVLSADGLVGQPVWPR